MKFATAIARAQTQGDKVARSTYRKGSYVFYSPLTEELMRAQPTGHSVARFRSGDILACDWLVLRDV